MKFVHERIANCRDVLCTRVRLVRIRRDVFRTRSRIMKIPGGYRAIKKTGIVHPSISFSLGSISLSLPLLSVFLSLALSLTTARGFTLVDAQK